MYAGMHVCMHVLALGLGWSLGDHGRLALVDVTLGILPWALTYLTVNACMHALYHCICVHCACRIYR